MDATIANMNESDKSLFTVKIPIRLPYHTDWKNFESVEGEVTYNQTTYKYVKRKVLRDTLILLCVNFQEKSQIQKNSNDFFKKINDLTADNGKKQVLKQYKIDFFQRSENLLAEVYPIKVSLYFLNNQLLKFTSYNSPIEMPPDPQTVNVLI